MSFEILDTRADFEASETVGRIKVGERPVNQVLEEIVAKLTNIEHLIARLNYDIRRIRR
jgi:hypothetical protein